MMRASIAFALALAACADDTDYASTTSEGDEPDVGGEPGELLVSYVLSQPDCDRAVLGVEVDLATDFDIIGPARDCLWTFDDGTTSTLCAGELELAAGMREFALRVRDPMAGTETTREDRTVVYPPFGASLEVHAPAGRTFVVEVLADPVSRARIDISPADRIVGGNVRTGVGRHVIEVTGPGAYQVQLVAEHERINGPVCSASETRLVTVDQ